MQASLGSASISAEAAGAVLIANVTGLVTAATVRRLRVWVAGRIGGMAGVLIDYSRTAVALTEADLQQLGRPGAYLMQSQPMAWVVPDEATATIWRRQALRIALAGERRYASCSRAESLAWVLAQVRLAKADALR